MCRSATAVKVELTGPLLTVVGRMHICHGLHSTPQSINPCLKTRMLII
jgi:hypothetical protein